MASGVKILQTIPLGKEARKNSENTSAHIKLCYWKIMHKTSKVKNNYSAENVPHQY